MGAFAKETRLQLHKPLSLFPTGEDIMKRCSSALQQRALDSTLQKDR